MSNGISEVSCCTSRQCTASPGWVPIAMQTCRIQCSSSRKKQWPRLRKRSRQYLPARTRVTLRSKATASLLWLLHRLAHRSTRDYKAPVYVKGHIGFCVGKTSMQR